MSLFRVGDRVVIDDHDFPSFWANGATGTVSDPPSAVASLADGWAGPVRTVSTTHGSQSFYWIVLDEARVDADGDGPYRQAEIAARCLQLLSRSSVRLEA